MKSPSSRIGEILRAEDVADLLGYTGRSRNTQARRVMFATGMSRVIPGTKTRFVFREEFEDYLASEATLERPVAVLGMVQRRARRPRAAPMKPMAMYPPTSMYPAEV